MKSLLLLPACIFIMQHASGQLLAGCGNKGFDGIAGVSHCPPPRAGISQVNQYTGNAHRAIRDLEIWGAVGEVPFVFMRYGNSRSGPYPHYFGSAHHWDHAFHFTMYDPGPNAQGRPQLLIHFPDGVENIFTQNEVTPDTWLPLPAVDKRLFQQGNIFFLQLANGHRYRFEKLTDATGNVYYQLQDFRDAFQNLYTLQYDAERSLIRITEPAGRFFQISYTVIEGMKTINRVTTYDGRSVQYNYDVMNDGLLKWLRLINVTYGDGTQARYNYSQSEPGKRPNLEHAIDPRFPGAAVNIRFTYDASITDGFLREELNGVTGQVMATFSTFSGERTVCYPNGRVQHYSYRFEHLGNASTYIDGLGRMSSYTYELGGTGFLKTITDPLGRVTTYKRTIYGNPLEILYPDGSKETWTRDDLDLELSYVDQLGRLTVYTRDSRHRITRITYADNNTEEFTYNGFAQVLAHTRRNKAIERYEYDSRGLLLRFTDAIGNDSAYAYDPADRMAQLRDPRGNISRFEYNERGLLTREVHADNTFVLNTYDEFGNWTSINNELNSKWTTVFDELRRPKSKTDPLGRANLMTYDLPGGVCGCAHDFPNPTGITLPSGKKKEIDYDVEWEVTRSTEGAGTADAASIFYEYDQAGNVETIIDPKGKRRTYTYDLIDRKLTEKDPLSQIKSWTYDLAGNIISETASGSRATQYQYDVINRRTQVRDPLGRFTRMTYDAEGNMTTLTDAKNQVVQFQYDLLNRKIRTLFPDGNAERYAYDATSNLQTHITRGGQTRTYAYDNRNREVLSDWSDATPDVTRSYDGAGRVLTMNSSVSQLSYTYNAANELTSETQAVQGSIGTRTGTVAYTYTQDGMVASIRYPNGRLLFNIYSARNQLTTIADFTSVLSRYTYDLNGNRVSKSLRNSTSTAYSYDDDNRLLIVNHEKAGSSFARYDYGYNEFDQRNFVKRDLGRGDAYKYDLTDEVIKVQYNALTPETTPAGATREVNYVIDAVGNFVTVTDNSSTTPFTSNNLNQYTNVNGKLLTYDLNGDITSFDGWNFQYDAQGRMISATRTGVTIELAYDAKNRNVRRIINGVTYYRYFDYWKLLEERNIANTVVNEYVYGAELDELILKVGGGTSVYYHHDALGNVMQLTNTVGNVIERYAYDIYGNVSFFAADNTPLPSGAFGNRFLFTGRELIIEAGLYDFRNRFYHPQLGRFIQMDPMKYDAEDINLYRYVGNNPVNRTDPMGPGGMRPLPGTIKNPQASTSLLSSSLSSQYTGTLATQRLVPNGTPVSNLVQQNKVCRKVEDPVLRAYIFRLLPFMDPNAWMLYEIWICTDPWAPDPWFQNPWLNPEPWSTDYTLNPDAWRNPDPWTSGSWNLDPNTTVSWFIDPSANDPWNNTATPIGQNNSGSSLLQNR